MLPVPELAAAVASILAPFTPYLAEGGKKFAGKAGEAAWGKAEKLWQKIITSTENDPKIRGHALILAAEPADPKAKEDFSQALLQALTQRPELASEIFRIMATEGGAQEVAASGEGSVESVSQTMTGAGKQEVRASDKGRISGVRQIKH